MPEGTLQATADHGDIHGDSVSGTYDASRARDRRRRELGISYDEVVQQLEDEAVAKFESPGPTCSAPS